jgi:hypothetical protein
MIKSRNRFKQTTSLEERLSMFTTDLRQQAATLEAGTEEAITVLKRISQGEAALRLNAFLQMAEDPSDRHPSREKQF